MTAPTILRDQSGGLLKKIDKWLKSTNSLIHQHSLQVANLAIKIHKCQNEGENLRNTLHEVILIPLLIGACIHRKAHGHTGHLLLFKSLLFIFYKHINGRDLTDHIGSNR